MYALFAENPAEGIARQINEEGCLGTAAFALGILLLLPAAREGARLASGLFGRRLALGLPTAVLVTGAVGALWGGLVEVLISQYTGNGLQDGLPNVVLFGVFYGIAGGVAYLVRRASLKESAEKAKEAAGTEAAGDKAG
jgi:hypothetical protein